MCCKEAGSGTEGKTLARTIAKCLQRNYLSNIMIGYPNFPCGRKGNLNPNCLVGIHAFTNSQKVPSLLLLNTAARIYLRHPTRFHSASTTLIEGVIMSRYHRDEQRPIIRDSLGWWLIHRN